MEAILSVRRTEGFIDAWGDDDNGQPYVLLTFDDDPRGRYHVEVPPTMIVPHPDELPMYGGEPIVWEIYEGNGFEIQRILRQPEQKREPLSPEVIAEITAALDRYLAELDEELGETEP